MNIKRIVSLAPSITETIFALGEGSKLVGVTEFCNYPPQAKRIDKIGGYSTLDIKKIIALSPDLVLATNFHLKTPIISQLENKRINTYIVEENSLLDVPQVIMSIGRLIDQEGRAYQLARDIEMQIKAITEQTKHLMPEERPRVCYICSGNPLRFARGPCCANGFIETAGGVNIGKEILHAQMNLNAIADKNPNVIIVTSGHGEVVDLISFVRSEAVLHKTSAWQNNRVYRVEDDLVTRFGPRVTTGIKKFAELIHPEIFGEV